MVVVILLLDAVIVVMLVDRWLTDRHSHSQSDEGTYRVMVALHRIRRGLQVSQFKLETRRDAADARRRLRAELDALDKREGQP
jgi:hypothetical protein